MKIDISTIVNLHSEDYILVPTLKSVIEAVHKAEDKHNLQCEIILVLDNPSPLTKQLCISSLSAHPNLNMRLVEVNNKDLSLSRNNGASEALGQYIAFIDGDDLWGIDWLHQAYSAATSQSILTVWHPEVNIVFDAEYHVFHHTDMDDPTFDQEYLRITNYWTALSFASKDLYLRFPYLPNELDKGFGWEDWNWNCQTIFHGVKHKVVKDSCHFLRKKVSGSLLSETKSRQCIMTPSELFYYH